MPRRKKNPIAEPDMPAERRSSTPLSQEARENMIISLAFDLAEQRLRDGTATGQEVTYWLRYGSQRDKLEREMMEQKAELLKAKTDAIKAAEKTELLYADAIRAFRAYAGEGDDEEYDDVESEGF
ncbi:MAG: hypothetical protein IKU36_01575 [Bacteroidales bacterium]|nr:hypothetical protein [Bacteroidales bacterium]